MKAIILSAGLGTRLGELTKNLPKCLVKVNGISLIENQLNILRENGIKEISLVIGNEGSAWTKENQDKIRSLNKEVIINYENAKTNNSHSLKLALENMFADDILVMDGDIALSQKIIDKLIKGNENYILSKSSDNREDPGNRLIFNKDNNVTDFGRNIESNEIYGGVIKIKKSDFDKFKELLSQEKYYSTDLGFVLQDFLKDSNLIALSDSSWININNQNDLKETEMLFKRPFLVITYGYTAVGKSTISKRVSKITNTDIFHSAVIRKELNLTPKTLEEADKFFDYRNNLRDEVDKIVYNKLAENALNSLKNGKNVVLDAGYFFSWQREILYNKVREINPEFFIIKVVCPDEDEIKRRLKERSKKFGQGPLNETPSWNTYLATKLITEPLEKDNLSNVKLNIIEYDSLSKKITFGENSLSDNNRFLINAIKGVN